MKYLKNYNKFKSKERVQGKGSHIKSKFQSKDYSRRLDRKFITNHKFREFKTSDNYVKHGKKFAGLTRIQKRIIASLNNIIYFCKYDFVEIHSCIFSLKFDGKTLISPRVLKLNEPMMFRFTTQYKCSLVSDIPYTSVDCVPLVPLSGFLYETKGLLKFERFVLMTSRKGMEAR